jgi:hypothetical protein
MKKILPIFLLILVQGCAIMYGAWWRHWDLGVCQESPAGVYGRTVKVPKCSAAVRMFAVIHRDNIPISKTASMRIRIQNKESHTITIEGLETRYVYLKPDESFELDITPNYESNLGYICCFDTRNGSIKVAIDILSGRPEGATISIVGEASDGP